ncbi:MAG: DUF2116 family Zn-ribbon domain-containing protein [Candidatus Thermoplasmatota archaeon]
MKNYISSITIIRIEYAMTEKIPQHTHCHICGKAVPVSETLCSEDCKQRYQKMMKKRRLWIYLMWALIAFTIIIMIVVPRLG